MAKTFDEQRVEYRDMVARSATVKDPSTINGAVQFSNRTFSFDAESRARMIEARRAARVELDRKSA